MNLVELLLGGAGGGIIGTAGSLATRYFEAKSALAMRKLELQHEIMQSQEERKVLELRLASEREVAKVEQASLLDTNASADFVASQAADSATYATIDVTKAHPGLIAVDIIRGLMRPSLTIGLATLNGYLTVALIGTLSNQASVAQTFATSSATLAGMAISWWFGARSHGSK